MKIQRLSPKHIQQKNPSTTGFLGGILLGALLVGMMMSQNQVKHFSLSDGSVVTTATTLTSTVATHTPPGGIRAAPRNVQPAVPAVPSSSSEEEPETTTGGGGKEDESSEEKEGDGSGATGVVSYARAYRDSGGFFDDISDDAWALMKQRVKTRTNYFDPLNTRRNIIKPAAWYQENFEPDFTCAHERRIGGMGDGPKWVCDPHRLMIDQAEPDKKKDCLVYSVGSEGNFMFENSILNEIGKHCEIHTFDPEIQGTAYGHKAPPGVNYHNWGFMSETEGKEAQAKYYNNVNRFKGNFKTMKETIETLGHTGKVIDVFKIDCEGCEWTTFQGWFNSGATLRQILVEVHKTPIDTVIPFFTGMQDAGYVTFHKEPNIQWAGGACVEYAFLKLEDSFFKED
eukprot:CAMPEP_0113634494 /NCGR_PEP_ID=MMETSP0017_2-20120614/17964_1 /TAXON_ID=2856 /ORGANISM="Cylindrotheca closterium" /LENGTH=397 /DNA_ID=CAMNT_0000545201 /DNA_START=204 /DNA_END=1397 /DNA_ORIENTATION=- /assembly_acc=CAM_ASM_000147